MTATVRTYRSTDASAPVLNGTVGSLIALLDAVLVNGYGSKPAAGWTKPYTGTNLAAFRAGAGTPRPYLYVDDTNAQNARVIGYDAMTSISAGTDPFPTNAQVSGGGYCYKSAAASSTARPWIIIACERAFYFFGSASLTAFGAPNYTDADMFFGVCPSFKFGDAFNSALICSEAAGSPGGNLGAIVTPSPSGSIGHYMARNYLQATGAIKFNKHPSSPQINTTFVGPFIYPDPVTGSLRLCKFILGETDNGGSNRVERGYMPGLWSAMHGSGFANYYDTFSGTSDLAGRTFEVLPVITSFSFYKAIIETNGSWGL